MTTFSIHTFPTELGWMAVAWADDRLIRLAFGHPSAASTTASLEADLSLAANEVERPPKWITGLAGRLQSYAAGNAERFDDVPLDLSAIVASVYERGAYGVRINYAEPPPSPPLTQDETEWMKALLGGTG